MCNDTGKNTFNIRFGVLEIMPIFHIKWCLYNLVIRKYNYHLLICLMEDEIYHLIREELNLNMLVCHIFYACTHWWKHIVVKKNSGRIISNKTPHGNFWANWVKANLLMYKLCLKDQWVKDSKTLSFSTIIKNNKEQEEIQLTLC